MSLIEKRKQNGFWIKRPIQQQDIKLNKNETKELQQKKYIIIDRDFGRFKISIPLSHNGDITLDIIKIYQLPRALK